MITIKKWTPPTAKGRKVAVFAALLTSLLSSAATAAPPQGAKTKSAETPSFLTTLDFKNPEWNRDTYSRLDTDLDPIKENVGWLKGKVFGVRPNEKVRELFILEGFSVTRRKKLEDGSIRSMLREVVFYKDVNTGEILKTWHNPYTEEDVRVVPIANDPYNYTISSFIQIPNALEGTDKKRPKIPFLLDWTEGSNDSIILNTGINLFYPNRLQPEKWVRESAGKFNRVSEQFIYVFKKIIGLPHTFGVGESNYLCRTSCT
jgi:hypothetical protein